MPEEEQGDYGLKPVSDVGSGKPHNSEKERLADIIDKLKDMYGAEVSNDEKLHFANGIADRIQRDEAVMAQVNSHSDEQIMHRLFPKRVTDAVLDAMSDYEKLSMPLLESEETGRQRYNDEAALRPDKLHYVQGSPKEKAMKKILIIAGLVMLSATASAQSLLHGQPETSYQNIGGTTFGSDGSTYQNIGNTTFGPGGSTSQRIGNTTFHSGGGTSQQIDNTLFNSDGTSVQRIGNSTFGSDGTTCQRIGNQTFCN